MAHFAKIVDGIVERVLVAEESFFETFVDDSPGQWLQTSYNTHAGQHNLGATPFRKNYAIIGGTYDATRDAFIPPKTYESWTLNETTCQWEAPVAYPVDDKQYTWNETDQTWDEVA